VSPAELPTLTGLRVTPRALTHDPAWLRTARRARWLSYFSLVWMMAESILGLIAGAETHSIGVIAWAIGSAVEGAAAVIVIVRLTGQNRFSETAERRAQKWVAGSFFLLVPYILYESVSKLIDGSQPQSNWLAIGLLVTSIVVLPALGPAILSGAALAFARSVGEIGSLVLIAGKTQIASIVIFADIESDAPQSAAALSVVLLLISLLVLLALRRLGGRVAH